MFKKLLILTVVLSMLTALPVRGAVTKYVIDANHSNVGFSIPIMGGFSRVQGKFTDFSVNIDYDDADVTKSSVMATIKAASIDTGVERRDTHLRTADFFDVEKFPEITFQSKRVEKKGDKFIAHGTFTMHGVSKEISIPFTVTGKSTDAESKRSHVGFRATLILDRRDYGITWANPKMPNWVGNEVEITLDLLARTPDPPKAQ
jgi:polyisoprenoid-binding protein YceI